MKDIKIVGTLIAGTGWKDYIDTWLEKMSKACDEIVVVDNSDREVTEKLMKHPKVYYVLHQKRNTRHGGEDYSTLVSLAKTRGADWILNIDIDEEIDDNCTKEKLVELINSNYCDSFAFELYEMIDDDQHWLVHRTVHKLYKISEEMKFHMSPHSSAIPVNIKPGAHSGLYIKHFGHLNFTLREHKRKVYFGEHPEYLDKKELESAFYNEEYIKNNKKEWKGRLNE